MAAAAALAKRGVVLRRSPPHDLWAVAVRVGDERVRSIGSLQSRRYADRGVARRHHAANGGQQTDQCQRTALMRRDLLHGCEYFGCSLSLARLRRGMARGRPPIGPDIVPLDQRAAPRAVFDMASDRRDPGAGGPQRGFRQSMAATWRDRPCRELSRRTGGGSRLGTCGLGTCMTRVAFSCRSCHG